jgi:hypothetical protein
MHQKSRSNKVIVLVVIAQNVAHVLAQKALNALAKFLNAIDIFLHYRPRAVRIVGRTWSERFDFLLNAIIPRNVGDQVTNRRKRSHRFHAHRLVQIQLAQPSHAHQAGLTIDFRAARAAFTGFAVPAHGEVVSAFGLDAVNGVQHDHTRCDLGLVFLKPAAVFVAAPNIESR